MKESDSYLSEQIITYIGNKRSLLDEIDSSFKEVIDELKIKNPVMLDLFSGSGIVARMMKQYASKVIANDLEEYSKIINSQYLSNSKDFNFEEYDELLRNVLQQCQTKPIKGIISDGYAPKDENAITENDRVFYTKSNALFIDSFRYYLENIKEPYRTAMLSQLIIEASIHTNTSGVFKGFYKDKNTGVGKYGGTAENALSRIKGNIVIKRPVFSNFCTEWEVHNKTAEELSKELKGIDIAYLDPPYNQHPYGSNYFMLNAIAKNSISKEVSRVSGIPTDWNKSAFNKKNTALSAFEEIIANLDARAIIVSYNNEGFISFDEMMMMLEKYGKVTSKNIKYNAFRGSRNLNERNIYTSEFIFVLIKNEGVIKNESTR